MLPTETVKTPTALKVGDPVQLKSGGHPMTVIRVGKDECECKWVNDDGVLGGHLFPLEALKPFATDDKPKQQ